MKEDIETYFFKSLIYVSTAEEHIDYAEILNILTHAWKYNHNSYISGMLLYDNKHFIQIIQGSISNYNRYNSVIQHITVKTIPKD